MIEFDNEVKHTIKKMLTIFHGVWLCVEQGYTLEQIIEKFEFAENNHFMIDLITSAYEKSVQVLEDDNNE